MVTAVSNNTQSAATQSATQSLASNYSTFRTLQTAQFKNQDPLNPTDSCSNWSRSPASNNRSAHPINWKNR